MFRFSPHDIRAPRPHGPTDEAHAGNSQTHAGTGGIAPVSVTQTLPPEFRGLSTHAAGSGRHALQPRPHDYVPVHVPGAAEPYYVLARNTPSGLYSSGTHLLYAFDPLTHVMTPTNLNMVTDGRGGRVIENTSRRQASLPDTQTSPPMAPPPQALTEPATHEPQPGPSGASSSRAGAAGHPDASRPLEQLLAQACIEHSSSGFKFRNQFPRIIHDFQDRTLQLEKRPNWERPNGDGINRENVANQIKPFLHGLGYDAKMHHNDLHTLRLDVTHRETHERIPVFVKLVSSNTVMFPRNPPQGRSYLLAVVEIDPRDQSLKRIYLIPVKNEAPAARKRAAASQRGPGGEPGGGSQPAPLWRGGN
jgi:hypothetical protein